MTITLEQARTEANRHAFGSVEWEQAMEVVRRLVEAENAATDFGPMASIEGDVWSV